MRSAYVALHTSEKLASATKARGWVGIIGKPRAVGARGVHAFFFTGGALGRKKERARTFGELPHDRVRGRGTAEFREPAVADVVHDLRHLSREGGEGKKTQHYASGRRFLNSAGGLRAGEGSRAREKDARTYRQPPRAGVLENFVARVLYRPLLERGGSPAVPHVLAHRAENKRDAFLKNVKAVAMVIRRVLGRKCVPPACVTREPAPRPDARSRESAKARLCSAHRRARARPREWRSCQIPALRSREKGSEMGEVHARNRVRTGFFPIRWRFQRVSTPKRPRFRTSSSQATYDQTVLERFFFFDTNSDTRDASNPFFSHYPNSLDTEGKMRKSSRGKTKGSRSPVFRDES